MIFGAVTHAYHYAILILIQKVGYIESKDHRQMCFLVLSIESTGG